MRLWLNGQSNGNGANWRNFYFQLNQPFPSPSMPCGGSWSDVARTRGERHLDWFSNLVGDEGPPPPPLDFDRRWITGDTEGLRFLMLKVSRSGHWCNFYCFLIMDNVTEPPPLLEWTWHLPPFLSLSIIFEVIMCRIIPIAWFWASITPFMKIFVCAGLAF